MGPHHAEVTGANQEQKPTFSGRRPYKKWRRLHPNVTKLEDRSNFPAPLRAQEGVPIAQPQAGRAERKVTAAWDIPKPQGWPGDPAERSRGPGVQAALPLFLGMAGAEASRRLRLLLRRRRRFLQGGRGVTRGAPR